MNSMGDVLSFAWTLRAGCHEHKLDPASVAILLPLEAAQKIHRDMVSRSPGADEVCVAWTRKSRSSLFDAVETRLVPKPPVPEPGEWVTVFRIRVFVVE